MFVIPLLSRILSFSTHFSICPLWLISFFSPKAEPHFWLFLHWTVNSLWTGLWTLYGQDCAACSVTQLCLTLWDPRDCSPPDSSVHSQARILEWVAISSSKGLSRPRGQTHVYCIGRQILYHWPTWEAPKTGWEWFISPPPSVLTLTERSEAVCWMN